MIDELNLRPMTVDEFLNKIMRPMFVFTMARAVDEMPVNRPDVNPGLRKSARTRRENAASEIDQLIKEYMSNR